MDSQQKLIGYARQIAILKEYPPEELEYGLQLHDTLFHKFLGEIKEFGAGKDYPHRLHEAADVVYYAACLEEGNMNGDEYYERSARNLLCTQYHLDWHECEIAALTKYAYRAAGNPKDEEREIALILKAIRKE